MSFLWFPCSFARDGVWSMEWYPCAGISCQPLAMYLRTGFCEMKLELFRALVLCCIDIIDITDKTDIVLSLKSVDASRSSYRHRMPWWIWLDASPSRSWSRRATMSGGSPESGTRSGWIEETSMTGPWLVHDWSMTYQMTYHQWKWSARCAWSTMGNPMLPTLLLCAIHESSSLLCRTNVYFKIF